MGGSVAKARNLDWAGYTKAVARSEVEEFELLAGEATTFEEPQPEGLTYSTQEL